MANKLPISNRNIPLNANVERRLHKSCQNAVAEIYEADFQRMASSVNPGDCLSDRLLTEKQLATRWSVSVKKIQCDRWKGVGIPAIYIGRCVRYSLRTVEEYEIAHTFKSTLEAQNG